MKQPEPQPKSVSITPQEIEAAKKAIKEFYTDVVASPYSFAEELFSDCVNIEQYERSRLGDIYNVMFGGAPADHCEFKSLADSTLALGAILNLLWAHERIMVASEDLLKQQATRLLDDAKKHPLSYAETPKDVTSRESPCGCRMSVRKDIETIVAALPAILFSRIQALADCKYGDKFKASRYEKRLAAFLRMSRALDKVCDEIVHLLETGIYAEEIAATRVIGKQKG